MTAAYNFSNRQLQMLLQCSNGGCALGAIAHHRLHTWWSLLQRDLVRLNGNRVFLTREGKRAVAAMIDPDQAAQLYVQGYSRDRAAKFAEELPPRRQPSRVQKRRRAA